MDRQTNQIDGEKLMDRQREVELTDRCINGLTDRQIDQGTPTEGEASVQLTSSLRQLVLYKKVNDI